MKKLFKDLLLALAIPILYNILGAITWYKHIYLLPLTFISVFLFSYYVFYKRKRLYLRNSLLITLPTVLIFTFLCFVEKDFSRGLPYILFIPLCTYTAYLFYKTRKWYIILISVLFFSFISFIAFPNFFIYYYNHDAERNEVFPKVNFIDNQKNKIKFNKGDVVVLDFWTTSCVICFEKFPILEETYLKYKNNKKVFIYSVNVPQRGDDFKNTQKILDSIGYKFPKIYASSSKEIVDSLHFNTYPKLLIVKDGKIRYNGYLENRRSSVLYNIEDQIDKLLKE